MRNRRANCGVLMDIDSEVWCVSANVKKQIPYGPGGEDTKSGLKRFKAGAKVQIIDAYRGMGESVVVIGPHRHGGKNISCVVRANTIENLRVSKVYSKSILALLEVAADHNNGGAGFKTRNAAEVFMREILEWQGQ